MMLASEEVRSPFKAANIVERAIPISLSNCFFSELVNKICSIRFFNLIFCNPLFIRIFVRYEILFQPAIKFHSAILYDNSHIRKLFNDFFHIIFMKAIDRLYQYLDFKGIKPSVFEKEISFSSGYLSVQRKRNADMGESQLTKVINYFDDLNPIWLLTGDGNMIRCDNNTYNIEDKTNYVSDNNTYYSTKKENTDSPIIELIHQLAKKDDNIHQLHLEIRDLIEENSRLKERITGLINDICRMKGTDVAQDANTGHSVAG